MNVQFGKIFELKTTDGKPINPSDARTLAQRMNGLYYPWSLVITGIHKSIGESELNASRDALNLMVCDPNLTSQLPLDNFLSRLKTLTWQLLKSNPQSDLPEMAGSVSQPKNNDAQRLDPVEAKKRMRANIARLATCAEQLAPELKPQFEKLAKWKLVN